MTVPLVRGAVLLMMNGKGDVRRVITVLGHAGVEWRPWGRLVTDVLLYLAVQCLQLGLHLFDITRLGI